MGLFGKKNGASRKQVEEAFRINFIVDIRKIGKNIVKALSKHVTPYNFKENPTGCSFFFYTDPTNKNTSIKVELVANTYIDPKYDIFSPKAAIIYKMSPLGHDGQDRVLTLNENPNYDRPYTKKDIERATQVILADLFNRLHIT